MRPLTPILIICVDIFIFYRFPSFQSLGLGQVSKDFTSGIVYALVIRLPKFITSHSFRVLKINLMSPIYMYPKLTDIHSKFEISYLKKTI